MKKIDNISSSQIRTAIAEGNFALAQTLLGHTNYEKPHVN
jgi:FAD synthase